MVWWTRSTESISDEFGVDINNGLDDEQVKSLREQYGMNEIEIKTKTPFWKLLLNQFDDQLVKILLAAALISFVLAWFEDAENSATAFVEPLVIGLILIANAIVGVLQETNAENAIEALKEYAPETANVLRNGELKTINTKELVPGDIIEISVGSKVPADCRIIELLSVIFKSDEIILTGESKSVNKYVDIIKDPKIETSNKKNMIFKGTNITSGKAKAIVVSIGEKTEMGGIVDEIETASKTVSPLQKKLDDFGELLSKVILVICIVVWLININQFNNPVHGSIIKGAVYYFKIAVALAVAAIPEGLPAVVTTCLALGTMKMAKDNAIVRSLPSVETLGCTTVICSDKTGTLTTSHMSVSKVVTLGGNGNIRVFNVTGNSYSPNGKITEGNNNRYLLSDVNNREEESLHEIAKIATLCNGSKLSINEKNEVETIGEPTELALKTLAEKIFNSEGECNSLKQSIDYASKQFFNEYNVEATLEFSRNRKSMSVLVKDSQGNNSLLVKGAPENIIERCSQIHLNGGNIIDFTNDHKNQLAENLLDMSKDALRVLGFAYIPNCGEKDDYEFDPETFAEIENDMIFVGLAGMRDPPREEVKDAIITCKNAGIDVVVITGDNKVTAQAICKSIGIFSEGENLDKLSYTGKEFEELSEAQQIEAVKHAKLFSRTEPKHKKKIVAHLQTIGNVVAMTGDGVNDAPALKEADIGIGMGTGTAVAKAASDMILADDNFATIVKAVREGRAIYSNTKQFIRYLISSNIGEVACIFFTAAIGMPEALIPVQLLWVNLVTDGLPATALGFNKPDSDIMKKPPRESDEKIINGWMFFRYMVIGVYIGIGTCGSFIYWYCYYSGGPQLTLSELTGWENCVGEIRPGIPCTYFVENNKYPSTVALSVLVTIEMFNALNSLSENQSLLQMPPWTNFWLIIAVILSFVLHFMIVYIPFFADIFQVAPISWGEWQIVLITSFPIIIIDELFKVIARALDGSNKKPKQD